ncbi:MAG: hypothetical protein QW279_08865 [Candidatus Jordarchaeaceae archaeon]
MDTLSPFYELDKRVKEKKSEDVLSNNDEANKKGSETHEPRYQALYTFTELEKREKNSFILDKTVLREICKAGTISLSQLRQKIASFEDMLGEKIDLEQIRLICDRYVRDGLIKQI